METSDALALLRLQVAWGADEALADAPFDRLAANAEHATPVRPSAAASLSVVAQGGSAMRARALAASATTLGELERALAEPGLSSLADTATHVLFGAGPVSPEVMFVADVPGDDDDRAGEPFAGEAGAMLDRMLGSIDVARDRIRITYLVPWRPPGGRPPAEPEVSLGTIFLRRHIEIAAPRRIVTLGALSLRALLGREAARRRAGKIAWRAFQSGDAASAIPLLVMPSPQAVRRNTADRRAAWES